MTCKKLFVLIFLTFIFFKPAHSQSQPAHSFYSFQTHFGQFYRADMDSASMERMLDLVKAAGFTTIRDECYWSDVEKVKGVYSFPKQIDDYILAAQRRGIRVLLILNYNNPLYAAHAGSAVTDDSNRVAYARYCRETVKRYAPLGVKNYEIWNEPNIPQFWDLSPSAEDYAELLKAAYPAIKAVDSTVKVLGCATSPAEGNPAPFIDWLTFITGVFQHDGGDFMDAVSFHYYSVDTAPENKFLNDVQKLQAIIGVEKPIWLTEFGYPANSGWPNITQERQANYASRLFILGKSVEQMQCISFYDLKNDGENTAEPEHNFGALNFDLTPKPVYGALKSVAERIGDLPAESQFFANNVNRYHFANDSAWTTAFWRTTGESAETISIPAAYCGLADRNGSLLKYFIVEDRNVSVSLSEQPQYFFSLAEEPVLKKLDLVPERAILFPGQTMQLALSGIAEDVTPVQFGEAVMALCFEGTGGRLENEIFVADEVGSGKIIGEYLGHSDTTHIEIVNPGNYVVEHFSSGNDWKIDVLNLDSAATAIQVSDSIASEGETSLKLDYGFVYKSSIHKSLYQVHLRNCIPIPGSPDSLAVDVFGNGQPVRFEFYFENINGEEIKESAFDQPATWLSEWRPVKILARKFIGKIEFPIYLTKILAYIVHDGAVNDSAYSGQIFLDNLRVSMESASGIASENSERQKFRLAQNYPNPFNPSTTIFYSVEKDGRVALSVFNVLGQRVAALVDDWRAAGDYQVRFEANKLAAGVYLYRFDAGDQCEIKKMVILK